MNKIGVPSGASKVKSNRKLREALIGDEDRAIAESRSNV